MLDKPSTVGGAPRQPNMDIMQVALDADFALLNVKQAAKALNVAPITVRRLVDKRLIRFYRICSRICFKKCDLLNFIESKATEKIDLSGYESR